VELGNEYKTHPQLISYLLLILFYHSLSLIITITSCVFYYFSINPFAKANHKGKCPYDSLSASQHLLDDTYNNLQRKDMHRMDMSDNNKGNMDQDESS